MLTGMLKTCTHVHEIGRILRLYCLFGVCLSRCRAYLACMQLVRLLVSPLEERAEERVEGFHVLRGDSHREVVNTLWEDSLSTILILLKLEVVIGLLSVLALKGPLICLPASPSSPSGHPSNTLKKNAGITSDTQYRSRPTRLLCPALGCEKFSVGPVSWLRGN